MKCSQCSKSINKKVNFHFRCDCCEIVTCADCGIDLDTACPDCGGVMDDFNEGEDA